MEHRNISLFRGYSDTESVETSLEEIVNIIKCDAALRDRTEKHRYYLQQDLRRDADREKSGCSCFAVAVCFEGGRPANISVPGPAIPWSTWTTSLPSGWLPR